MAWLTKFFGAAVLKFSGLSTTIKLYIYAAAAVVVMGAWGFSLYKAYHIGNTVGAAAVTAKYEKAEAQYKKKIGKLEDKATATAIDSQAKDKEIERLREDIITKAPKTKIVTREGKSMTCSVDVEASQIIATVAASVTGTATPVEESTAMPKEEDWYLDIEFAKTWNAIIDAGK